MLTLKTPRTGTCPYCGGELLAYDAEPSARGAAFLVDEVIYACEGCGFKIRVSPGAGGVFDNHDEAGTEAIAANKAAYKALGWYAKTKYDLNGKI